MKNPFQKVPIGEKLHQAKEEIEVSLDIGVERLLVKFNKAVEEQDPTTASDCIDDLRVLLVLKQDMTTVLAKKDSRPILQSATPFIYLVGSPFLRECFEYLTQDYPEWMVAVTGLRYDNVFTLAEIIPLALSHQSVSRATASGDGLTQVLLDLDAQGYALHAIFHSHRFSGIPHPSGVDIDLQRNIIEAAGYPAIQAVFSEDGYVSFFSDNRRFQTSVYGKGVERVGQETYRLTQVG